ncbi:hypothetical protein [Candidatus Ichthyocystis sparus]|uniref:hypothetical protein n=1 Tax=Candidatus Ichthyocystis sparus TaxID=1561004 RepID=UPI00159EC531|nr:hypothetical protein [Candidatus Ichthyocystis sparus]
MYNQGDGLVEHHHMMGGDCITTRDEGSVEDSSGQSTSGATKTAGSGSGATSTSSASVPSSSAAASSAATAAAASSAAAAAAASSAAAAAAASSAAAAAVDPSPAALTVILKKAFGEDWGAKFGGGFANGLLGTPGDPDHDDNILDRFGEVEDFFLSQNGGNLIALLAEVLMVLARSSGEEAANERKVKMEELLGSLKENLEASSALSEGATEALVSGVVAGVVGLVGAGAGMFGSFYASKLKSRSGGLSTELEGLGDPEATDLVRVDMPGGGSNDVGTVDAAQTLQAQKSQLVNQITELDKRATTVTTVSEGVGRMSGSAASVGSTTSTMQLTKAQATQSYNQSLATQKGQEFGIEDDWQKGLSQLRDMILNVMSDAVRSFAQANSSAFRS